MVEERQLHILETNSRNRTRRTAQRKDVINIYQYILTDLYL